MKMLLTIVPICLLVACKPRSGQGELLPSFNILLTDSVPRLNTAVIKEGVPIALLYFSPDCEHCQKETEAILRHMDYLKLAQFYFITNDPFDRLKLFKSYYKLDQYSNITIGIDEQFFLLRHFKGAYPPYLVLYDRQKRKRVAYQGEISVDTIISFIRNL